MKYNHYVYHITNLTGNLPKYYIGYRSCKCEVKDDPYFGSSWYLDEHVKKYGKQNFKKKIVKVFETRKEASNYEVLLLTKFDVKNNDNFYNKRSSYMDNLNNHGTVTARLKGTKKYHQIPCEEYKANKDKYETLIGGIIVTENGKSRKVSKEEFATGKYTQSTKDTVTVIRDGERKRVKREEILPTDEKYWSGYIPPNPKHGKISVIYEGNILTVTTEEYYNNKELYKLPQNEKAVQVVKDGKKLFVSKEEYASGDYEHAYKGKVNVYDKVEGISKKVSKEEYNNNRERYLKSGGHQGIIKIYNGKDELMYTVENEFLQFIKEKGLPLALQKSYLNNGERLFQTTKAQQIAARHNNTMFIGWYATKEK